MPYAKDEQIDLDVEIHGNEQGLSRFCFDDLIKFREKISRSHDIEYPVTAYYLNIIMIQKLL